MERYIPLVARFFLSVIFLRSGIFKILDFSGTQAYMASKGIPETLTATLLVLTIGVELVGGCSVLLGYRARWGALALCLFLIPATLIFHTNFAENAQTIQFFKNVAIFGGLLMVYANGSGALSIDQTVR
ncbi:DoxX family protein [Lyngbya confervoides]|uniref:DoxX family protein n=1 Tax=Lyngbya confervoides BDU141951 TaxID=1574623 RepID=A0ABD4T3V1_9CYAN|nr:DoxX family protein [Lyngbya confervoides]MCM1983496.1 DoxX family protein [Lyngbya confervoides BDU141951]